MMMKLASSAQVPIHSTRLSATAPQPSVVRQRQCVKTRSAAEISLTTPSRTPKPLEQAELPLSPFEQLQEALARISPKPGKGTENPVLQGNLAPIRNEMYVQGLPVVEGVLPREINGMYMRNGPNPLHMPYASHHIFEGDGMVHAVRIKDGCANYCNTYVDTYKIDLERKAGRPIWGKFADMEGPIGVGIALLELVKIQTGLLDMSKGNGTANTNLEYHAGKLMALHEGDMPYQLYVTPEGVVRTVRRMDLGESWRDPTDHFTAHPKYDGATGNMHFFSYDVMTPQIKLGTLDPHGRLSYSLKVDLPGAAMIHDMAITPNFKVIFHFPLVFDPAALITENSLPLVFRENQPSRIGLVPHKATSQDEIQWFELPSFMTFHVANAWEEGPDGRYVEIYLLALRRLDMNAVEFKEDYLSIMHKVTLDRKTGSAHMRKLSSVAGDFPVTHPMMQGQRTRFAWTTITDPKDKLARNVGIAKFDMSSRAQQANNDACCAQIRYPAGCYGGESSYVPRNTNNPAAELNGEDDGFLVVYMHAEAESTTYMMVYDAQTMSNTPVAKVKLPQRVPYGFHGTYINNSQLMSLQAV
ncbi:carotenoid oxygenase [Dunaliella salina]|uniref:carotenoid 9,10-dioxygenase n=1 Tax=Dunaliella salina TaxID=3046 RepID=A0ABQ7G041_DUNSA|nr:carotenoid oxygenase [Dunaliella salina]|eukprot:KAF5827972.1 carotenoid oxygenase [Dunaliella salina]